MKKINNWSDFKAYCSSLPNTKAVGDEFKLMSDPVAPYTFEQALRFGRELEKLNYYWYEEPLFDENFHNLRELTRILDIPIIGNGDITNTDDVMRMFDETGCDAVMIARGCLGNPWIFKAIQNRLNGIAKNETTVRDRIEMCKYHFTNEAFLK